MDYLFNDVTILDKQMRTYLLTRNDMTHDYKQMIEKVKEPKSIDSMKSVELMEEYDRTFTQIFDTMRKMLKLEEKLKGVNKYVEMSITQLPLVIDNVDDITMTNILVLRTQTYNEYLEILKQRFSTINFRIVEMKIQLEMKFVQCKNLINEQRQMIRAYNDKKTQARLGFMVFKDINKSIRMSEKDIDNEIALCQNCINQQQINILNIQNHINILSKQA